MTTPSTGQEAFSPTHTINALDYYYADLSHLTLLTHQEEQRLARRVREGDERARACFIEGNLRLVVHLARAYTDCGLPREDLIQEGNIGLVQAVDRFDPDRGALCHLCHLVDQASNVASPGQSSENDPPAKLPACSSASLGAG